MGNFLIGGLLAVLVIASIRKIIKDKKNGRSLQCGGNCAQCKGCH